MHQIHGLSFSVILSSIGLIRPFLVEPKRHDFENTFPCGVPYVAV